MKMQIRDAAAPRVRRAMSVVAVRAHHGDAGRYEEEVITVTGTVVALQMVNPHSHIILDVVQDGKTVRWQAELGTPQQLIAKYRVDTADDQEGDEADDDRTSAER